MICCVALKNENQSMNLFVDNMIISNECEKTTGKCQEKNCTDEVFPRMYVCDDGYFIFYWL